MPYVLGLDAGGTKTVCVVADADGVVKGIGRSGSANFQGCGRTFAQRSIAESIERALKMAGAQPSEVAFAYYGISGADRDKDFDIIGSFLSPVNPAREMKLENDTVIALRAGTHDGVGIGLIVGTGMNAVGFNRQGARKRVGGLGRWLGDFGSAADLVEEGIARAMLGHEGRGDPTCLYEKFRTTIGLERLEDIIELFYFDSDRNVDIESMAPLVFEAANEGDRIALMILQEAGRSLASSTNVLLRSLFQPEEEVNIVLGGSVLQKGENPAIVETLMAEVDAAYRSVVFQVLDVEPVLGAVFFALDQVHGGVNEDAVARVRETYGQIQGSSHTASAIV